eukprot:gene13939-4894_t
MGFLSNSEFQYDAKSSDSCASGKLLALIDDEMTDKEGKTRNKRSELLSGDGNFVNEEYCVICGFAGSANVLASQLSSNGVLASSCSGTLLYTFELGNDFKASSVTTIPKSHPFHSAAVLCLDFHPTKKSLLLTGGMDGMVCLWDLEASQIPLEHYKNHKKYVVRVKWSPSGRYFATASYDKSICIFRIKEEEASGFDLLKKLDHAGCVEAICFKKDTDVLIASVRDDNMLSIYDLAKENINECDQLNMNAFGDDYVSFNAMDLNISPSGRYLLTSTDQQRIILFDINDGAQVANYYGVINDEYSQPRNCWHPSERYFYTTSDDNSICVFEVSSGKIVQRLKGHEGRVRDLMFCNEFSLLVSSSYDSTVRMWHQNQDNSCRS